MRHLRRLALMVVILAALSWASPARAGWSIGIGVGGAPYYRPYWGGYYYRPYPVYVAPPPVVVQPAPVYQPVYQPVYSSPAAPPAPAPAVAPAPAPAPMPMPASEPAPPPTPYTQVSSPATTDINLTLQQLESVDERVRGEAVMTLGRSHAGEYVSPLIRVLRSDRSPTVREAAARALGLIASPSSLAALEEAAQADADRDVRRSASFAAEIIQANQRR